MSPYTVTNPATGQLEAEYPSATESGVRQAIADAAFAVLKHIDAPGTFPPPPAAPPVEIYLSLRETADPQVTDKARQAGQGVGVVRPVTRAEPVHPGEAPARLTFCTPAELALLWATQGKPHATWSPIPPIPWPPHAREP